MRLTTQLVLAAALVAAFVTESSTAFAQKKPGGGGATTTPFSVIELPFLDDANALPHTKVFHAGTAMKDGQIVTNGGRVLGVTALGKNLCVAQAAAYAAVECIQFEGAHFRRDIAAKAMCVSR